MAGGDIDIEACEIVFGNRLLVRRVRLADKFEMLEAIEESDEEEPGPEVKLEVKAMKKTKTKKSEKESFVKTTPRRLRSHFQAAEIQADVKQTSRMQCEIINCVSVK